MASMQHPPGAGGWIHKGLVLDRQRTRYVSAERLCARADLKQPQCGKKPSIFLKLPAAAGPVIVASLLPDPAGAVAAEDLVGTLNKVQEFSSQATSTVVSIYSTAAEVFQQAYSFLKPALDVTLPFVQRTSDLALKAAAPVASGVASQAVKALQNAGVDTKPVLEAGQTAVTVAEKAAEQTTTLLEGAKPVVSTTFDSLITSDPLVVAGEAGALVLLYFLAPGILSSLATATRGYKGDLTAPQALDFVCNKNYMLVDVRTEKEKSRSGIPSLSNKGKRNFVAIPIEEFPSKLRSQLRNPRDVEAEVAAIKISALKKTGKGTNIVILDSSGNIGKTVAKSLCRLGLKNSWIVIDGFDGGRGWVQNRLGKESYYSSFAEVMSPSRIIPAATNKLFKTTSSAGSTFVDVAPRSNKLLPSGD